MNLTIFQYITYGVLSLIALYLIYMITTSVIWLFWMLITILIYGGLLIAVVWFLHKQGFFELFKGTDKIDKPDNDANP
ncbi:hypothetical protein [Candidatus Albibeggiatoa sp. nov. NOAA]|uniref:hypothetical protein n=1 Tax=Candidatus Albibeggiatoa sp. nov. NOAA TaxID=3162724 RepID=UPI0033021791|nr:hypothetical protein [Thiotrichaceae bacterium]